MKQKGFTLIELLVVIVIIGILATISVATFSGYFAKARDTERQSAIRNTATILKTARAVNTIDTFDHTATDMAPGISGAQTGAAGIDTILADEGGFAIPAATTTDYNYSYFGNVNEFAVFTCSEENASTVFVDGTSDMVAVVRTNQATYCPSTVTAAALLSATVDLDGDAANDTPIDVTN